MTTINGVRVVVKQELFQNVVSVNRVSDRLMAIKIIIGEEIINIISAYAPQIGLTDVERSQFLDGLENLI